MLVLGRKKDEKIIITTAGGERIEVVILKNKGSKVSVGIKAPLSVTIQREELEVKADAV